MSDLNSFDTDSTDPEEVSGRHRPLEGFSFERVDDEMVVLDLQRLTYHSMNESAFRIWELSDGVRTIRSIQTEMTEVGFFPTLSQVAFGIDELDSAGLMDPGDQVGRRTIDRRSILKLAGAAALALPVISSISIPNPAAAQSGTGSGIQHGMGCTCTAPGGGNPYCCGVDAVGNQLYCQCPSCFGGCCSGIPPCLNQVSAYNPQQVCIYAAEAPTFSWGQAEWWQAGSSLCFKYQ